MSSNDKTIVAQPGNTASPTSALILRYTDYDGRACAETIHQPFTVGRGSVCRIRIRGDSVSREHAQVYCQAGRWWVRDLRSANGCYLNGARIDAAPLTGECQLQLGTGGPFIRISVPEHEHAAVPAAEPAASVTQFMRHYLSDEKKDREAGDHTMMVRQAFKRVVSKKTRRYGWVLGVVGVLLVAAAATAGYQYYQLQRVELLAQDIFYQMKELELEVVRAYDQAGVAPSDASRQRLDTMRAKYDNFIRQTGLLDADMSEQDKLIYRMARVFGECEINMPPGFVAEVKQYIERWRATDRLPQALARLRSQDLGPFIYAELVQRYLPPQLMYLALQESDFRSDAIGPETRFGIAKGMWQFIPSTAVQYGLETGPLVELPSYDPRDQRFNPQLATRAAARYLFDIYSTEAQASGLLVIAGYNWGHNRVRRLTREMPANPRERNFWLLLANNKVPQETRDYVFYIFSAAVIGENPALFGFDFQNPLAGMGGALQTPPLP